MKTWPTIIIACLLAMRTAHAQPPEVKDFHQYFRIHVNRIPGSVKIDGVLDDSVWRLAEKSSAFHLKFPTDEGSPSEATEARLAYDDKFLYLAFTCYDNGKTIVQSMKRDIGYLDNDGVGVVLDPLNSHTSGFIFMVNAFNAQSEDQISLVQDNELTWNWNNKWFSATRRYKDRWVAEMAIPFKTLRYPPDLKEWGINFIRVDMEHNEYSAWTPVPRNFRIYNLGYSGALIWDQLPPDPGRNLVMIPYVTGSYATDAENQQPAKWSVNAGLDSKFTLTSSLNLDLTLNPDFSQVEVDQQVTNLTRYDIFLPEKRSFFLENADLFGEYGIPGIITPFYSRRIGLDKDGNRIPILGGARLSGNLGNATRIGVMDIQTSAKGDYHAENYSAISIHQNVFSRSVLKAYFLNRQSFETEVQKKSDPLNAWGRNAGLSFDFINRDGKWNGWIAYHHSFKPGVSRDNQFAETGFAYNGRSFSHVLDLTTLGTNYYTDMGYVQRVENYDALRDTTVRVGFKHLFDNITYKIFPKASALMRHTFSLEHYIVFNPNNSFNERDHTLSYKAEFRNNATAQVMLSSNELNLLYPTSFTDGTPLPAANYHYSQFNVKYNSDTRKSLGFNLQVAAGGFYNGRLKTLGAGFSLRKQPYLKLVIQGEYDLLEFPFPYGRAEIFLISPRVEINFNTKCTWTTFLQYNTQDNNYNINSRLQYRFRPMSDLFFVYTDNYFTSPFLKNKNRAIVFKWNYWLNL